MPYRGNQQSDLEDKVEDRAMEAFIAAFSEVHPSAPTWCAGWSAHELAAHVAAADEECAALIAIHLSGLPTRPTRSWAEREPAYLALADDQLYDALIANAVHFQRLVEALDDSDTIPYTGWKMSGQQLRTHSRSEAALHRWDLVGSDSISQELLSDPALFAHAVAVFTAIPDLAENRRWVEAPASLRLRASGQPDVLVEPGMGLSLMPSHGDGRVIEMDPHDRLLVLWGRCPPALRAPVRGDPETVDDLLLRLARG